MTFGKKFRENALTVMAVTSSILGATGIGVYLASPEDDNSHEKFFLGAAAIGLTAFALNKPSTGNDPLITWDELDHDTKTAHNKKEQQDINARFDVPKDKFSPL